MAMMLPDTVDAVTDQMLAHMLGDGPVTRGREYARQRRITDLEVGDDGSFAEATVIGSGGRVYETFVGLVPDGHGRGFVGVCSCPWGGDCKHVVALVKHLQRPEVTPSRALRVVADPRDWESTLDQVLDSAPALAQGKPLALELVVRQLRYGGQPEVIVEPRAQGARGGWIKTGASWNDLEYATYYHRQLRHDPAQVEAIHRLRRTQAMQSHGYYSANTPTVTLSDVGEQWFALLSAAQEAGVTFLSGRRRVELLDEPARLVTTVSPPASDAPAGVSTAIVLPEGIEGDWHPITDSHQRGTGWVAVAPDRLTLVAADRALDTGRLALSRMPELQVPASDWACFALTRLPALRRLSEVVSADPERPLPVGLPPQVQLSVRHHPGHQSEVAASFRYALEVPGLAGTHDVVTTAVTLTPVAPDGSPHRDPAAERALTARLTETLRLDQFWSRRDPTPELAPAATFTELGVAALVAQLADLAGHPDVHLEIVGDPADYVEAVDGPTITVGTGDSDDRDWFDLLVCVTVGDEEVPLATLIAALATGQPALLLESGTWFSLDRPELQRLAAILAEARLLQDKPSSGLRLTPLHADIWQELVSLGVVAEQSAAWQERVAALTDLTRRETIQVPDAVAAELRSYQLDGFRWLSMLWDSHLGGILADDMGLGKTLQVLTTIARAREADPGLDPVLIVCPTSVIPTWLAEAAKFTAGLRVAALTQTRAKAGVDLATAITGADVVVTSYALLRIDEAAFGSQPWSALVLDEAQFVKNHRAKGYAAARRMPAARVFALTGTPLENSLMDLWSLLSLVAPGLYPRPDRFKEHFQIPIERQGSAEMLTTLRRRIRPLMLRRTKESVAAELPPKQETVVAVPLAPRHRTVYDRHLQRERQRLLGLVAADFDGNRIAILRALTLLRQLSLDPGLVDDQYAGIAASAKIDLLVSQLRELADEGHRALVFSQFTGFLQLVRQRLAREGLSCCYLDGRTRNRDRVIADFRGGDAPAFLISLKAGGFGLTLTEADYVFVLDPWWNPAAELQAIDRTHRIGQDKPVNVYRLVSSDTIEEKVVALQERKRELFTKVVDDGSVLSSALTAEDIRGLLET